MSETEATDQPKRIRVYMYHIVDERGKHRLQTVNSYAIKDYSGSVDKFESELAKRYPLSERLGSCEVESPTPATICIVLTDEAISLKQREHAIRSLYGIPDGWDPWMPPAGKKIDRSNN